MKKLYFILKLLLAADITAFTIYAVKTMIRYLTEPERYIYYSAPWYTGIEIYGIAALFLAIVLILLMYLIRRKWK